MKKRTQVLSIILISAALVMSGCSLGTETTVQSAEITSSDSLTSSSDSTSSNKNAQAPSSSDAASTNTSTLTLKSEDLFSERDLEQTPDTTDATYITVESGKEISITQEGVYVISGEATDCTIKVDADAAKVQLVLDGVKITNTDSPAIYVVNADKFFITTTSADNTLEVTGTFTADGDTNTDAVIYSKDDIVFNGTGELTITSTANGITGKNDVKFTGGVYNITATEDAVEAKDSIRICDGSFTIKAGKDGLHSENSDDDSVGFIYVSGGSLDIDAEDDGIQATTTLTIDGGDIDINAAEGMEATYVQINNGNIKIYATDDGINASNKSSQYDVVIEINGGNLTIEMASGDTDALDANGKLIITGGTIDITAQFAFDFDDSVTFTGGTVTVNGEEVTEITNSMFGGQGGFGGGPGGQGGFGGGPGGQGGFGGPDGGANGFSGERPEMPEGMTPPSGDTNSFSGERPEIPEGMTPQDKSSKSNSNSGS